MKKLNGLTRADVIVAIACLTFLIINIPVISAAGRTRAKREVCQLNLRALTEAWYMYAEDNAGKLVNGSPMPPSPQTDASLCPADMDCPPPVGVLSGHTRAVAPTDPAAIWNAADHLKELPWVGPHWAFNSGGALVCNKQQNECHQKCAVQTGALWKYTQDLKLYRCPLGRQGDLITYAIADSMNGNWKFRSHDSSDTAPIKSLFRKNLTQVIKPDSRLVFIEEAKPTWDSYGVLYDDAGWYDMPCARHEGGSNVSYADGHCAYWKWKSQWTVDLAKRAETECLYKIIIPTTDCAAKNDVYKMQMSVWGEVAANYPQPPPPCVLEFPQD